nr:probable inactive receptor kinase At1g27190 [Tanacetum cinerariifolium]
MSPGKLSSPVPLFLVVRASPCFMFFLNDWWLIKHWWRIIHDSDTYGTGGMTKRYVTNPQREFRTLYNTITDDMLKKGLLNVYNTFGIKVCRVGAKIDCKGQTYAPNFYVKLLVKICYNVDSRGTVKGEKNEACRAIFLYNLGSVGDCYQEDVKGMFGLTRELSKLEKDRAATRIDNQFPIVQVNYRKLNVCILLNCDEGLRETEKMDFLLELCALHIDSSDMKLLEFLLVLDSENHVEPNVAMDLSSQFSSSKWANEELISSRLKGTLLTDKRIPYLVVRCNKVMIHGNEASVADESLTFIIFETLLPCVGVPSIHFATGIVYYITRGKYIMLKDVKRESKVVRWLVKWKWKLKKLYGRTMSLWKKDIDSLDPWGQESFEEEGIVMLAGGMPKDLEPCESLQKLDLLGRLSRFSVMNNELSGSILSALGTFVQESFEGNSGLCGASLSVVV